MKMHGFNHRYEAPSLSLAHLGGTHGAMTKDEHSWVSDSWMNQDESEMCVNMKKYAARSLQPLLRLLVGISNAC